MDNDRLDLSPRFYLAEVATWILGAIVVIARYAGLSQSQNIPYLGVIPEKQEYVPKILASVLCAASVYLVVEWKQSQPKARGLLLAKVRFAAVMVWVCISFYISYPLLIPCTPFADVPRVWVVVFLALGVLLGACITTIVLYGALMIRPREEATKLHLPRIPAASRAQFITWGSASVLIIAVYFVLLHFAPPATKAVGPLMMLIAVVFSLLAEIPMYFFNHDNEGKRVSFRDQIARMRKACDYYDYACIRQKYQDVVTQEMIPVDDITPQYLQKKLQKMSAAPQGNDAHPFSVRILDNSFNMYVEHKNCGSKGETPFNYCFKILKKTGDRRAIRVAVSCDGIESAARETGIPVASIEAFANMYIAEHGLSDKHDKQAFRTIFEYAMGMAIKKTLFDSDCPALFNAVMKGNVDSAKELLGKKITEVNVRSEFGWTPLLAASAQGYPELVEMLLDAGANPDISNVNGITPLMYGAMYGNDRICQMLISYKADLNIQDVHGQTALMVATAHGHQNIVELLLQAGADVALKVKNGKTALDAAYICKQGKIAKALKEAIEKAK